MIPLMGAELLTQNWKAISKAAAALATSAYIWFLNHEVANLRDHLKIEQVKSASYEQNNAFLSSEIVSQSASIDEYLKLGAAKQKELDSAKAQLAKRRRRPSIDVSTIPPTCEGSMDWLRAQAKNVGSGK